MIVKRKKAAPPPMDETPRTRRAYMEARFGQLHVTTAFPMGGGFDEHVTLVCLHRSPLSSRVFKPFMQEMGRDRPVYAPDLPGYGESDPPPQKPAVGDYANAIADFLDQMRFREVDLIGQHSGSLVAAELALARPEVVRRLILLGVPVFDSDERARWMKSVAPLAATPDGGHLAEEWQRSMGLGNSADDFAIQLHNGVNSWWLANAAFQYSPSERLPLVTQPVLLVRANDCLLESTSRARAWLGHAKSIDLVEAGSDLVRSAPALLAAQVRLFLDRGA